MTKTCAKIAARREVKSGEAGIMRLGSSKDLNNLLRTENAVWNPTAGIVKPVFDGMGRPC